MASLFLAVTSDIPQVCLTTKHRYQVRALGGPLKLNEIEKISMVLAQRWHGQIMKCTKLLMTVCEFWLVIEKWNDTEQISTALAQG